MTQKFLNREARQKEILDQTLKIIEEVGLQQVTIRSVALASGLSKGGLSHYYVSKKALLKDTFTYYFEGVVEECIRVTEMQGTCYEKLRSFDIIFDLKQPKLKLTYPILYDFMAEAIHDKVYRAIYDDWVENWVQIVKRILEKGIDDGSFISSDVDSVARTISAFIQGIGTRCYFNPTTHSSEWAVKSYHDLIDRLLPPP